jgi:hypothetical protein
MTGCERCGVGSFDRDDPFEAPVHRSHWPYWKHRECHLRDRYAELKQIIAEHNDMDPADVSLAAAGDGGA